MKLRHLLPLVLAAWVSACHSSSDALRAAIDAGDHATVQAIVSGEDDAWARGTVESGGKEFGLLDYACKFGSVEDVELLLKNSPAPKNLRPVWGTAVRRDSLPIVRALYAHGLKPSNQNELLRSAASAEMVNELMDRGANPLEIEDSSAIVSMRYFPLCTPASDAAFKAMVERVGWQNIPSGQQEIILMQAVLDGDHVERLRFLMDQGLDMGVKLDGKSLSEYAAAMVPFEYIVVPRAMKCGDLLRGKGR